MLKKELRLSEKRNISEIFKKGRVSSFEGFFLRFLANGTKKTHLGVFVGVKYSKKAVDRNRIRRRIWAIIDRKYPKIKKGMDIIIIPSKSTMGNISPHDLDRIIQKNLERSGLIEK